MPSETMPGYGSALGDVNGDGFVDLVMGRSWQWRGRVFVYAGGKAGLHEPPSVRFIGPLMHRPGVKETPEDVGFRSQTAFGASVAATDVDHDGFADVIVGAPWDDKFYVYPGRSSFPAAAPRRLIGALRQDAWFPTAEQAAALATMFETRFGADETRVENVEPVATCDEGRHAGVWWRSGRAAYPPEQFRSQE